MSLDRSAGVLAVEAPAKVNLFLEVTRRRPDGYHDLETVFAKLELADSLTLRPAERSSLALVHRSPTRVSAGPDNLVLRAAEAFRASFGGAGASIRLVKRVPAGAGLGGGSSDAAATLLGLARQRGVRADLSALGRGLGADVPFFLQPAPLALGRGIGDRLRPMKARGGPWWLVVVYPGVSVSTPHAFRRLRLRRGATLTTRRLLVRLRRSLRAGASPSRCARKAPRPGASSKPSERGRGFPVPAPAFSPSLRTKPPRAAGRGACPRSRGQAGRCM
jgi:4-diphosphocytidyl-2-C-methyl-D-erythritol kinase